MRERLLRRWDILDAMQDTDLRRMEMELCRRDVVYWVNRYCWTFDPREEVSSIPFDLFPKQEEFLRWLRERDELRESGLAEKSRDVGFTWLCADYAVHAWIFKEGDESGFGSRKEDLVDKLGDMSTILEKIRFTLRKLPKWMMPKGFRFGDHDGFCKIVNPANGSMISGEAGDQIGRGGRKSRFFVDEAAFLAHPDLVDGALLANTDVRIDISTPNGAGGPFYTKRFSGKVPVFTFHYRDDPRKTAEWVAKKKAETDPVSWAREYEIDYTASLEGICIPGEWVRAAVNLHTSERFKSAYPNWKLDGPITAGLDIAEEGKNKSVLIPKQSFVVMEPIAWGQMNTTQTAHRARTEGERLKVASINYDCIGVGAGVKGTWESAEHRLPFRAVAVRSGESPTETRWPDGKTSAERFTNLRAEMAWVVRSRFERAYEFMEQGVLHRPEDMISIPNDSRLIGDLSLPLYFTTETGKVQLESKRDMQKRGIASPDFFDAMCLLFMPAPKSIKVMKW